MKQRGTTVLLVVGMLASAELPAQTPASTTFRVSANVQAVCAVTATDLDFSNYNAQSGSPLLGQTMMQVNCTPGSGYHIALNAGTSPGATVNQRKMVSGANRLDYQLYSDANRTKIWGNTVPVNTVFGVGTGVAQQLTVFGSVPAAQVVPAGSYTDTITVNIYY